MKHSLLVLVAIFGFTCPLVAQTDVLRPSSNTPASVSAFGEETGIGAGWGNPGTWAWHSASATISGWPAAQHSYTSLVLKYSCYVSVYQGANGAGADAQVTLSGLNLTCDGTLHSIPLPTSTTLPSLGIFLQVDAQDDGCDPNGPPCWTSPDPGHAEAVVNDTWVEGNYTVSAPPVITTSSLPPAMQNGGYVATVEASGGLPKTWSIASGTLPSGLSLDTTTGVISGTPTSSNIYEFSVQVSDQSAQTAVQALQLPVLAAASGTPPSNQILSGSCTSFSQPGQEFVLNGLGQRSSTTCDFGPSNPTSGAVWGEAALVSGTLTNLTAKQSPPNGYTNTPGGGKIAIFVYPKGGTSPISTGISCTLGGAGAQYSCTSSSEYSIEAGDRIIAIVTPPANTSVNPVSATVEITPSSTLNQTISGYCDNVGEWWSLLGPKQPPPANLIPASTSPVPFVLKGLGQDTTSTTCQYGAGTPHVSTLLGSPILSAPGAYYYRYNQKGTIHNLFAKQQQHYDPSGVPGTNGGTVEVWVNRAAGGMPELTQLGCDLTTGGFCNDAVRSSTIEPGDRVIVRVVPPASVTGINPVAATLDFTPDQQQPRTVVMTGMCIPRTYDLKGTPLSGLGQKENGWCDYPSGDLLFPDVWLGEPVTVNGTIANLYVKQQQLELSPGLYTPVGGTVTVWVNHKDGEAPVETGISCTLSTSPAELSECQSTGNAYQVSVGDRIIAIATPASNYLGPTTASVEVVPNSSETTAIPFSGYCNAAGNVGQSSILFGLGQRSRPDCKSAPAALSIPYTTISSSLGEIIPSPGQISSGVLTNLSVKQELGNAGQRGGIVTVWLSPKNGTPVKTALTCTLTSTTSPNLSTCFTAATVPAAPGDRVIVVADSPEDGSYAPLSATVDFVYTLPSATTLSVSINDVGTGRGNITSSPAGINCGGGGTSCYATFASGTIVTLTPSDSNLLRDNVTFQGWGAGRCSGNGPCIVKVDTGLQVDAYFSHCTVNGDVGLCRSYQY